MDDAEDLYALLQVHAKASPEVIKKAYHTLMQKNHPDRGGDLKLAQRINRAYDILIDSNNRKRYDLWLEKIQRQREMMRTEKEAQQRKLKAEAEHQHQHAHEPAELKKLEGNYQAPMLWGTHLLLADERGHRVVLMNLKGEVVWKYGKKAGQSLKKPHIANFSKDGHILITDTGQQQVLKLNLKKQILWGYTYQNQSVQMRAQAQPIFADSTASGGILLTDKGHRMVMEVDKDHQIAWQFNGQLAFNLKLSHLLVRPELFLPVSAFEVEPGLYLIADQGNGRILLLNRKGKLIWIYPEKKNQNLPAVNFAYRLKSGNIWISSDKLIEVNPKGEIVWEYSKLSDVDIKQAYPLEDNRFLVDFSHLVKRGINQEIMLLDHTDKILFRHYYSQHRFI
jgi:curved DNA-binding protein CbpA